MPYCIRCQQEKQTTEMLRDKHAPDGSGLSRICRACGRLPGMQAEVRRVRERNTYAYRVKTPVGVELTAKLTAIYAERRAMFLDMETCCNRCRETKPLTAFPVSRYGPLMHSETCEACWSLDPDRKVELARERARHWSRAQALKRPNDLLRDQHDRDSHARYLDRRAEDNQLRDYSEYGYTRKEWKALGHERREEIRKAVILAAFGAEVVSEVSGVAAARDVDNETVIVTDSDGFFAELFGLR